MQAEETTLPPPNQARGGAPYRNDEGLLNRLNTGLTASGVKYGTKKVLWDALTGFSAWLEQVGKSPMQGRLFTEDLALDVRKFVRLGGDRNAPSALFHLRNMESSTHGTTQMSTLEVRWEKAIPDADRLLVDLAFGANAPVSQAAPATKTSTETTYRSALQSFSEWLALAGHPGLADSHALHSAQTTALARQYVNMGLPYGHNVMAALTHLRQFDVTGTTQIKRNRNTLNIPEADQRLIERYRASANEALEATARETGKEAIRDTRGQTKYDRYASCARSFSAWLQEQGMRSIASRLDDDYESLKDDLDLFADGKKKHSTNNHRTALREMRAMLSEAPEVTMARIGPNRFVNALGMLSANTRVGDVARATGANEDDLRMFLDEESATGLTEAGQAVVNGLDGRLRQAADANIALRVQSWGQAAQHTEQMPVQTPSPYHLSPMSSSAFPSFSGLDDPSGYVQHGGQSGSQQHGIDSVYGGLGSLGPAAHYGHGFDLNTPSADAVRQPRADSPYHLSPMSPSAFPSFSGLDDPSGYTQHGGQSGSQQHGIDSVYGGLGSLGPAAHYGHGFDLNTPSADAVRQPRADSPYHLSPMSSSAFPSFSGLDDPSGYVQHGGQSGSQQHGIDSVYGGLGSPGSVAHFDLNTPAEEAADQGRADSAFDSLSSLGSGVHYGTHGVSYPSTTSEVAGPSQPSQAGQPLPIGPMHGSLHSALRQLNLERGFASGDSLNCLIDTALQLSTGVRRPDNGHTPMPDLDRTVPLWRQHLFAAGVVPQHGMIDLYSATHAGQDLAHNLSVRIQIIQWENGRATAHPVLGQQGPLAHILHTPGHFQPLWPRNG
ncbi:hypothetical protein ACN9M1_27090 (plasmid) [Ralstonia sp. R-29]|uniref:hypothetical protein n=1 Tax=Ralstonia sp. R-29 TaxID=3404059 RepID=UPI003CF3B3F2